jgi:hypothetical protein
MKFKWHTWIEGELKHATVSSFVYEDDEYPIAIGYMGNVATSITIEAVSGLLSEYSSRCNDCIKPGAHNLARGPVEILKIYAGYKDENGKLKFNRFDIEHFRIAVFLYTGFDPGECP